MRQDSTTNKHHQVLMRHTHHTHHGPPHIGPCRQICLTFQLFRVQMLQQFQQHGPIGDAEAKTYWHGSFPRTLLRCENKETVAACQHQCLQRNLFAACDTTPTTSAKVFRTGILPQSHNMQHEANALRLRQMPCCRSGRILSEPEHMPWMLGHQGLRQQKKTDQKNWRKWFRLTKSEHRIPTIPRWTEMQQHARGISDHARLQSSSMRKAWPWDMSAPQTRIPTRDQSCQRPPLITFAFFNVSSLRCGLSANSVTDNFFVSIICSRPQLGCLPTTARCANYRSKLKRLSFWAFRPQKNVFKILLSCSATMFWLATLRP